MTTCYLVKDMNGRAAANTTVTADYAGVRKQAVSDAQGIARFSESIPYDAKVYVAGQGIVTRVACPISPPSGPGRRELERVGYTCSIQEQTAAFGTSFVLVHDSGRDLTPGYPDLSRLREVIPSYRECFVEPAPTPDPLSDVKARVGIVEDALQSIRKAVEGLSHSLDTLEAWLIEHLIRLILVALDQEVKKNGR